MPVMNTKQSQPIEDWRRIFTMHEESQIKP